MKTVKAWREDVVIPTYEIGKEEKNPIFLEKRVYQGSSGVVYPYPVVEKIADEPTPHTWHAVWMENEYIKVMILPELGGRVQMAYDKIRRRHFVYYNHVIKPALVGLTGPWISGGIEFNWPQHHRPSTYLPVDSTIEENADGSVTVWVNEMEKMFHQKGAAGFTLRPGCAYLEIKGRLYNRTDVPQTFLWWANPAVEVNDEYQSVFPPDINAVFDHGKRAVSSFPIATGTYYKMDYSSGVDISNYKNIKVPTSYMGVNSRYNFEGGYENDTKAGMLHVASNHFSPGKKQWTWGNGDFGRAWDRVLTDAEKEGDIAAGIPALDHSKKMHPCRPYIELMAGVYTENQPDFTWLMPYEEKRFTQYFMPYRELGVVKQASKDLVLNVNGSEFMLYATNRQHVRITLKADEETVYDEWHDVTPENVLHLTPSDKPLTAVAISKELYGREQSVLSWQPEPDEIRPIPDAAEAALLPHEVKTCEQLFLTGQHIEQYRHATYIATDYYEEALRRNPDDVRCLNAMGLWYIRRGRFDKAEPYLRHAVKVITRRNPNPYDGEPIYNLALCLKYSSSKSEAYNLFWKATWNKAWADAGYFEAAKISVSERRLDDALEEIDRCLIYGAHNQKALALKAAVLRLMGRKEEMEHVCREALKTDLFNYGCLYELGETGKMREMMHGMPNNYDEIALDYQAAGLYEDAAKIWEMAIEEGAVTPMTYYYLGQYDKAEQSDSNCCFPNSLDALLALQRAKAENPKGAKAYYYLGCLYYDKRQYDLAKENWEASEQLDASFPTVHRNLALLYYNKENDSAKALQEMETAFSLDETDARIFMELDQLYKRLARKHTERLAFFEKYPELVEQRDDLLLEYTTLLNQTGRYEDAMRVLDTHRFHAWEGGEGKIPTQYQMARVEMAKRCLATTLPDEEKTDYAIRLLTECLSYPENLGEGKLFGAQENDFYYLLGIAYRNKGDEAKAHECWRKGTEGPVEPAAAMYYNDAKPDKIFYAALCYRALGEEGKARTLFNKLLSYGKQHLFDQVVMDYFAVSLPDLQIWEGSLQLQNEIHCRYMLALGYYGLGDIGHALRYLREAEQLDPNHVSMQQFRSFISLAVH